MADVIPEQTRAMDEYHLKAFRLEVDQMGRYLESGCEADFFGNAEEMTVLRRIRELRTISTTYNQQR